MRAGDRVGPEPEMVVAARAGDERALDLLVAQCLPLVYNIVGRALDGHDDVDDVVQETLLRVVRGLGELRDPTAFRSWLVAIAVRQVRDREQARKASWHHRTALDAAELIPDPASDFASVTILRLGLTDQRREIAEATRWLDGDDRTLLALWWLEETGDLGRSDLADALGLTRQHAAVKVQRMKEQLETSRTVVRALGATGACDGLRELVGGWDGVPSPLWRKRFGRHVRGCDVCGRVGGALLPMDRLLSGLPLLPVPGPLGASHLPAAGAGHVPPGTPATSATHRAGPRTAPRARASAGRGPLPHTPHPAHRSAPPTAERCAPGAAQAAAAAAARADRGAGGGRERGGRRGGGRAARRAPGGRPGETRRARRPGPPGHRGAGDENPHDPAARHAAADHAGQDP